MHFFICQNLSWGSIFDIFICFNQKIEVSLLEVFNQGLQDVDRLIYDAEVNERLTLLVERKPQFEDLEGLQFVHEFYKLFRFFLLNVPD